MEADHLGTPRLITDSTQAQRWYWHSAPYGDTMPNEKPGTAAAVVYNLRFAGQYFDKETNTHYNWHRDYEATTGRYLQSDPAGLRGGINTYAYVWGDPLSLTDPTGQNPAIIAGAILGGISGAWGAIASSGCGPVDWWKVSLAALYGAGAGAAIGALAPTILVDAGIGAALDAAVANVGIRVASSAGGNLIGQGYSYITDPSGSSFNPSSFVGSSVAGAFGGVLSVGGAIARAEGWASSGVLGRVVAGAPGPIAAAGIAAENAPGKCGCP